MEKEQEHDEANEITKSSTLAESCPSEATAAVIVTDAKTSLEHVVPSSGEITLNIYSGIFLRRIASCAIRQTVDYY